MAPPSKLAPTGWPIVQPGLLMTYVGPVCFIYFGDEITPEGERIQSIELARAIDERPPYPRIAVITDHVLSRGVNASARNAIAKVLTDRRDVLARAAAAFALASDSVLIRGMMKAIFWMAPPPYPHTSVATTAEALAFVRSHLTSLDVTATHSAYLATKERYRTALAIGAPSRR